MQKLSLKCKIFKTKYIANHINIQINDNWDITFKWIQNSSAIKNLIYKEESFTKH